MLGPLKAALGLQETHMRRCVYIFGLTLQVPGGYQDSLSKNTKLGKALDEAVNELDTLGELVISLPAAVENILLCGQICVGQLFAPQV